MSAPARPPTLWEQKWVGCLCSDLGAEVGEGICQGCGGAESRAAGEWNEKAVKWQSKCLWEMEGKTIPCWERMRGHLALGSVPGHPSHTPGTAGPPWGRPVPPLWHQLGQGSPEPLFEE